MKKIIDKGGLANLAKNNILFVGIRENRICLA
jgi:hypothetical protein